MTSTSTTAGALADRTRSRNLDALRAVAALYVLAGHAYILSGTFISSRDRHPLRLAINTGGAGVWLFFALSGYLISSPWVRSLVAGDVLPGADGYARRRALRIFPAYWAAFAVVLAFGLSRGISPTGAQVVVHGLLLHNLVPGEQHALYFASWTLTLEVIFYAAVPAAARLIRRRHPEAINARSLTTWVVCLWGSSVLFTAVVPELADGDTLVWLRTLFPSMLSMFCPGILVAVSVHAADAGSPLRWYTEGVSRRRASLLAVFVLCVGGAVGATLAPLQLADASRQLFAVASGLGLALAVTGSPARRGGRALAWLGMISYGVYLWQGAVLQVLLRHEAARPMAHAGAIAYVIHLGYLLALTIPLAWLSWRAIEHPALQRSRPG